MAIIKSKKSLPGISVPHRKHTEAVPSITYDQSLELTVPMQQHMGAPCLPTVKEGDTVLFGQKIGDTEEFFSAPIHAPCSGEVLRFDEMVSVAGAKVKTIVLKNDLAYTVSNEVAAPTVTTLEEFTYAVRESGAVGLGGAGFPTHVKLAYKFPEKIHKLVVNAAECEPYITADHRACLEDTADVLAGIVAVKKFLGLDDVYFGVEANKPDVLAHMDSLTKQDTSFHVVELKSLYPQGAEKSLIYATTGVTVTAGKLPADCGVIVMNVSSLAFIGQYLRNGMPLVRKRLTVDGTAVGSPKNLIVPIGTPIIDVLHFCDIGEKVEKILMGGPMMGLAVHDIETPIIKNNNAILAFTENEIFTDNVTACIRCGRCTRACPMNLMPVSLEKAYDAKDASELEALKVSLCISCGCCSYVCPANRHLAQKHQLAKTFVRMQPKKA